MKIYACIWLFNNNNRFVSCLFAYTWNECNIPREGVCAYMSPIAGIFFLIIKYELNCICSAAPYDNTTAKPCYLMYKSVNVYFNLFTIYYMDCVRTDV